AASTCASPGSTGTARCGAASSRRVRAARTLAARCSTARRALPRAVASCCRATAPKPRQRPSMASRTAGYAGGCWSRGRPTRRSAWEYWDGEVWRGFKSAGAGCEDAGGEVLDSTQGLTQSGRFLLQSDCAEAKTTTVNGVENFWIRGRLLEPLPPDPAQILPL